MDFYTGILSIHPAFNIEAYGIGGSPQSRAEKASRWANTVFPAMEFHSGEDTTLLATRRP